MCKPSAALTRATLVVFPGALGDFTCFLPTLHALRTRYPAGTLVVIVSAPLLPLAVRPGLGDVGHALESARVAQLFVAAGRVTELAPGMRIGDVYCWFGVGDPILRENLTRLAAGTTTVGRFAMPPEHAGHVARYFLESAGFDPGVAALMTCLPLNPFEAEWAREFWRHHGLEAGRVLAVHRGAGSATKRWSDAGYAAVTSWWRERGGAVLEIVGPADPVEPLARDHTVAREVALGNVAALLGRASLFLGNDSGVSHLAGAVGARGAVVFGPTRARSWRPLGGRLVCVKSVPQGGGENAGISLRSVSIARVIRVLDMLAAMTSP